MNIRIYNKFVQLAQGHGIQIATKSLLKYSMKHETAMSHYAKRTYFSGACKNFFLNRLSFISNTRKTTVRAKIVFHDQIIRVPCNRSKLYNSLQKHQVIMFCLFEKILRSDCRSIKINLIHQLRSSMQTFSSEILYVHFNE